MAVQGIQFHRKSHAVKVNWRDHTVVIGGMSPVVVQSMTNTATTDVEGSVSQIMELWRAGSELVRLTVNTPEAARSVVAIRNELDRKGCNVPLVGGLPLQRT